MTTKTGHATRREDSLEACHVCGIVRARDADALAETTMPDDAELRVVHRGDVAAIVALVDPTRQFGTRADLLAHSGILNGLAASWVPVVPVRFGSMLDTLDDVAEELLVPNEVRWSHLLEQLSGLAQFTVRGTYLRDRLLADVVDGRSDVAELRERTMHRDEQESYSERVRLGELVAHAVDDRRAVDVEHVRTVLEPHCTDIRTTAGTGLDGLVDIAALVTAEQASALETAAEHLAEQMHERATFRFLGPLAPFDFVSEG